ncbi:sugar transferase [Parvularcula sp. LCG005]|uniref:sugar transferase n=1 Tax=Parvularcula sp. LCG005 TaxID=3078805 RepID=UPI0029428847|nr:sugar transferase [Parvularcula sp. LCG005]WOI52965.1 sugar transferase [Parvularcula sp. LCG005]
MNRIADGIERQSGMTSQRTDEYPAGLTGPAKRLCDLLIAIPTLGFVLPLLVVLAVLIKLQDGGPVFYRHTRCGLHGSRFTLLKFRTMAPAADDQLDFILAADAKARHDWLAYRKLHHDPRVTRLGRFLRRSSLDELPQLLNVIMGDMSLVGPRPIVEEEVARFGTDADAYFAARPGLTGLWQISGRNHTDYDTRVALDAHYVRHWNFWLDVKILLRTVPCVLLATGAR